jgi:hypothetical protein
VLKEVLEIIDDKDNLAKMEQAKQAGGNDLAKMMQNVTK